MVYIAGVDEAGRGPLIGDLFMALVAIDDGAESLLRSLGVRDSKKLTRKRREELFGYIAGVAEAVLVARVLPSDIDKENINTLEIKTLCRLIAEAYSTIEIDRIYIDAFVDPNKITNYLRKCLEKSHIDNIVAVYDADSTYVVVSAASIIAKVLRDRHIDTLKQIYGDFGSGYPSDERTIDWLKKYYQNYRAIPPIVRKSWKTIENTLGRSHTLDRYTVKRNK